MIPTRRSQVALDIGATGVRVVAVGSARSEEASILRAAFVPLPSQRVVRAGRVLDVEVVADAIDRAFSQVSLSRRRVVVGFNSPDAHIGTIELPSTLSAGEIPETLENMFATSSRRKAPTHVYSSYVSSQPASDPDLQRVCYAAVPVDQLNDLLAVCELADVKPHVVDLTAAALARALVRTNHAEPDGMRHALVDIGATQITVVVRDGDDVIATATVAGGADEITDVVATAAEVDFDEAAAMVPQLLPAPPRNRFVLDADTDQPPTVADRYTEALGAIASRIAEALLRIDSTFSGADQVNRQILITGGGALAQGLVDLVARRTGLPAHRAEPWAQLSQNRHNATHLDRIGSDPTGGQAYRQRLLLPMAVAVGLGTWRDPR